MNYYVFVETSRFDVDSLRAFLYRTDKTKRCAAFAVNDETCRTFLSELRGCLPPEFANDAVFARGEDGAIYRLCPDGAVKESVDPGSFETHWKQLCRCSARVRSEAPYQRKMFRRFPDGVHLLARSVTGFHQYVFVDRAADVLIPFRFRAAKGGARPLVVYFGGGGTNGHRNDKPLLEFLLFAAGNRLLKRNCNLFIPQFMFSVGSPRVYAAQCNRIVQSLLAAQEIDRSRVYVYGTSLGGKCTWRALLDQPELYAAALTVMGALEGDENEVLERIAAVPLWLAHAADDPVVRIENDDRCYERLKALGVPIRYTRRDRGGHQMYRSFYRNEDWQNWLFSKRKPKT